MKLRTEALLAGLFLVISLAVFTQIREQLSPHDNAALQGDLQVDPRKMPKWCEEFVGDIDTAFGAGVHAITVQNIALQDIVDYIVDNSLGSEPGAEEVLSTLRQRLPEIEQRINDVSGQNNPLLKSNCVDMNPQDGLLDYVAVREDPSPDTPWLMVIKLSARASKEASTDEEIVIAEISVTPDGIPGAETSVPSNDP